MFADMIRAYIGLGSNVGEKFNFIQQAVNVLSSQPMIRLVACSALYRTEPVGNKGQADFLNGVAEIETTLSPLQLYQSLKTIEAEVGRKPSEHWGPREIDLDLLYYGDWIVSEEHLRIPHTEAANRRFVLVPLKELAESFVDPLRKLTIAELLGACSDTSAVRTTGLTLKMPNKEH